MKFTPSQNNGLLSRLGVINFVWPVAVNVAISGSPRDMRITYRVERDDNRDK